MNTFGQALQELWDAVEKVIGHVADTSRFIPAFIVFLIALAVFAHFEALWIKYIALFILLGAVEFALLAITAVDVVPTWAFILTCVVAIAGLVGILQEATTKAKEKKNKVSAGMILPVILGVVLLVALTTASASYIPNLHYGSELQDAINHSTYFLTQANHHVPSK